MNNITFLLLLSVFHFNTSCAQDTASSLPNITTIAPYKLEVGYNTTTLIIFPVPLVPSADRGNMEIIIQQEKSFSNVLKI